MDIYLTETGSGGRRFTFPSLPERIRVKTQQIISPSTFYQWGLLKFQKE